MTLFRTLVRVDYGLEMQDGLLDTISWKGSLWLVWRWRAAQAEGLRSPARAVRLDLLDYRRPEQPHEGEDYVLVEPITIGVLDGTASALELSSFVVVDFLPVEIPFPTRQ